MSNENDDMTKLKQAQSQQMRNLASVMPMVEEITAEGLVPLCLIGFSVDTKTTMITSRFSTLNDAHDQIVYEVCKQLVESLKDKYE